MESEAEKGAEALYGISELAREFGVTARAIRFYEDEGLIRPLRRGARRLYRSRDRTRLKLILRGRRLGFSLKEIREILRLYDAPPGEAGQLRYLLERIGDRRRDLEARRHDLETTLSDLEALAEACSRRLAELGQGREGGRRTVRS